MARIFNAVPGSPPINIYVDGEPATQLIEYKEITNYIPTRPGTRHIEIYNSQDNKLLLTLEDFKVVGGQIITFATVGSLNDFKFIPIIDDINETIMPDETKVRFYNLDASDITFNIHSTSGSISTDLTSGNSTNYTKINPGDHNLQIRLLKQTKPPVNMKISFKPGRIYTLYIVPSVDPNSENYDQLNIPQVVLTVDGNTLFNKCIWF